MEIGRQSEIAGSVLMPNSDEAVYVLSKHRDALSEFYKVTTPPWGVIKKVYDKKQTYEIAASIGIPIPRMFPADSLEELLSSDLQYPAVVKPSIRDHLYSRLKIKGFRADNVQQLVRAYRTVCKYIDPAEVIVQDFVPGGPKNLYSYCPFFRDGEAIAYITARRARQHPMDFGHASTFAETVASNGMARLGERFLRAIGYYGLGEVEFMYDERDGTFKLIEVNPRIWGWHTLAAFAGVDLLPMIYADMTGETFAVSAERRHARWVRVITDLPTAVREILLGRMSPMDYLRTFTGGTRDAVFSLSDPLPFVVELALIPYLWLKRGF
jgi:predicted ATP-grasp superfamily ATP-dependent carboligase